MYAAPSDKMQGVQDKIGLPVLQGIHFAEALGRSQQQRAKGACDPGIML
jgi:hypothetical protein